MKASVATNEQKKTGTSPATTVSTEALRVGLAQLIHEITNPLQLIYNTAHLMELRLPAVNGCRDPLMVEMLEQGKHEIEHLTSLLAFSYVIAARLFPHVLQRPA